MGQTRRRGWKTRVLDIFPNHQSSLGVLEGAENSLTYTIHIVCFQVSGIVLEYLLLKYSTLMSLSSLLFKLSFVRLPCHSLVYPEYM